MKKSAYLITVFALTLVLVCCSRTGDSAGTDTDACEAAIENIMTRTSVRAYTDRAVSPGQIDTLLRAAMAAPTAGNMQPWRFVVVDDRGILDSIGENFGSMGMARQAPLAVVMCGDVTATFSGEGREYWVQDVSAASENLLLAAHAMGLGAVWCGIYPISERVAQFSEMLGLPSNIIPLACICIGYPAGPSAPKDKWQPDHIHRNHWSAE